MGKGAVAGHGIAGMRERAARYGGRVEIRGRDAGGTVVRARLPLSPSRETGAPIKPHEMSQNVTHLPVPASGIPAHAGQAHPSPDFPHRLSHLGRVDARRLEKFQKPVSLP